MLISVCYLVVKGLLQTQSDGSIKLMDFLDEQRMHRLYEKFILEYYRREHPQLSASAAQIPWQLDDDTNAMLPVMRSDIMLTYKEKTLIIDAKYYAHSTQFQYDKHTIHSGNLYQIFTYVKNKQAETDERHFEVSGMLLYARTDEDVYPENEYRMSGNRIEVRTLNLDGDFALIKAQLDEIAEKYLS
jgi:5-methylcytosine-specific restriction enzyme subunit McrC